MTPPRKRLTKKQQSLSTEYIPLVSMLAKFFLQNRPIWQRGVLRDDLEGEGLLALAKASRTYDPKRLPYPKAYFARAILNSMLKYIKKATRQPRENRVSLAEAESMCHAKDELDHLRMAIDSLPLDERRLATDRFSVGLTLRALAVQHQIPIRVASRKSQALARRLAQSLDIQLCARVVASDKPPCGRSPSSSSG
jgi:RNA polymerase sigma factor (sigma-70 family)